MLHCGRLPTYCLAGLGITGILEGMIVGGTEVMVVKVATGCCFLLTPWGDLPLALAQNFRLLFLGLGFGVS